MYLNFWLLIVGLSLILKCESSSAFKWNLDLTNNFYWAIGCDYHENNLKSEKMVGEKCGKACAQTPGCSHFTWSNFEGGTCWMKKESVSKSDAFSTGDMTMVCGVLDRNLDVGSGIDSLKGQLLWSDEFDSLSNFMANWNQETGGHGWGNNELQYYTNNNENTEISNGMLTIHTRKEWKNNLKFTSAKLLSTKKFRYGVYEMKAKLPYGRGTWSAFWLLSARRPSNWPNNGEIDIMEHVGYEQNVVHATIHCKDFNHIIDTQIQRSTQVNDASNQFHLYQLYWSEKSIRGYVDAKIYFRYDRPANGNNDNWPFDDEFSIILNTAVGGEWGGALGIDDNIFPQKYVIDYVRHFAHK
ncbi:glycoside hydrolase [Brachionus plicatilis]|uniref:Glycoside hydrolase n=1 Tax=Brachionus plicatilis TaxID=10195 RepID=A0A3M7PPT2_BRAPC|nr:glycoside hydrolase [Brachionus plicatilis]